MGSVEEFDEALAKGTPVELEVNLRKWRALDIYVWYDGPCVFTAMKVEPNGYGELLLFRFYDEGPDQNRLFRADMAILEPGRIITAWEDEVDFTKAEY